MGPGAPKSGGLREAHGAPQAGEGQQLERFLRGAPAVLVVLVREPRLTRDRGGERRLARKERRGSAAPCAAARGSKVADLVAARGGAGLLRGPPPPRPEAG